MSPSIPSLTSVLLEKDPEQLPKTVEALEALARANASEIRAQQLHQLEGLLRYLEAHPLWQRRLPCRSGPLSWEDFRRIPILTKQELLDGGERFEVSSPPPAYAPIGESTSSGSTGTPLRTRSSWATSYFTRALQLRSARAHGLDLEASCVFLTTPGKTADLEQTEASSWSSPLGSGRSIQANLHASAEKQGELLRRIAPRYLATYPSNWAQLLDEIEFGKLELPFLDGVYLSSEPVEDAMLQRTRRLTRARCLRTYSANEVGLIAMEPVSGEGLELASENVFVEVLREDGTEANAGEVGRIVVTTLQDLLRPLLRYDLGDYGVLGSETDGSMPRLLRIQGRERSLLRMPDGRKIWPYFEFESLGGERPFRRWQLRQSGDGSLHVRAVPRGEKSDGLAQKIVSVVTSALPGLPVTFEWVDEIERAPSGKYLEVLRSDQ